MNKKFFGKKIVVTTHSLIYSASQALRDYLRAKNVSKLVYIAHPLLVDDARNDDNSFCEVSVGQDVVKRYNAPLRFWNLFLSTIYETLLTVGWVFRTKETFDVYVGVDNLNAFHGLILKLLGRVNKVVYYTIDYYPTRFENRFLNWFYHQLDKFCVRHCDETWNVASSMVSARKKHNQMGSEIYNRQYTVPIGVWYDDAPRRKVEDIDNKKLVFVGHLQAHMGVDLVINSLPRVSEEIPGISLDVIGGGRELEPLKNLAEKKGVKEIVNFHGWIKDRKELEELLSKGAVGLATFNTEILDDKVRNADPAKIKDYLLLGMPVIVTNAISVSRRKGIEESSCGIVINYNEDELVKAVVKLLKDETMLRQYRENALKYIKQYDYNNIFSEQFCRLFR